MIDCTKPKKLKPVWYSDTTVEQFYRSLRKFHQTIGCTYLAYFVEDLGRNIRMGFASNPEWQREFVGDNLIEGCHLWNAVKNQFINSDKGALILPWDTVTPKTSLQKDIHLYRIEKDIGVNGISFCTRQGSIREYFALAPDLSHPSFVSRVSKHIGLVKEELGLFRKETFFTSQREEAKEVNL